MRLRARPTRAALRRRVWIEIALAAAFAFVLFNRQDMLTTAKPEIIRMLRQAGAKFYADPRIPVR